jgi:uncharacterized protein
MSKPLSLAKYGPWALVTGASSGLGAEFARQLAPMGFDLVLSARRRERMDALAAELEAAHGIRTRVVQADLSRQEELDHLLESVQDLEIGLLVNNAGFGTTGNILETPLDRSLEMLHLNCRAPLVLAHALGRKMRARGHGGIVFTASLAAWQSMPGWTLYAASKNWDLMLAEGLHFELAPFGVDVLALCPGATRTEFGEVAGTSEFFRARTMAAPDVVAAGLSSLGRKSHVVVGAANKAVAALARLVPRHTAAWIAKRIVDRIGGKPT